MATQAISLEMNRKIVVPELSCRQLEALITSIPELVTKSEELLIDFVTSISSEEEGAKESH